MARNYAEEYKNYHSSDKQKKDRASRNNARREALRTGRVAKGDGKDIDHKNNNPRDNSASNKQVLSKSSNRSFPRNSKAGKKRANANNLQKESRNLLLFFLSQGLMVI